MAEVIDTALRVAGSALARGAFEVMDTLSRHLVCLAIVAWVVSSA